MDRLAGSGERFPSQPELRHNRGILDTDSPRVQDVLHPNRDAGEKPPRLLLPPGQDVQACGHPKIVKEVMRMSEQAMRLEKRRITRHSFVQ